MANRRERAIARSMSQGDTVLVCGMTVPRTFVESVLTDMARERKARSAVLATRLAHAEAVPFAAWSQDAVHGGMAEDASGESVLQRIRRVRGND